MGSTAGFDDDDEAEDGGEENDFEDDGSASQADTDGQQDSDGDRREDSQADTDGQRDSDGDRQLTRVDGERNLEHRVRNLDNTTGEAWTEAEAGVAPQKWCYIRPDLMLKEAVTWMAAYFGILFAQYLADIALIMANSYGRLSRQHTAQQPIDASFLFA